METRAVVLVVAPPYANTAPFAAATICPSRAVLRPGAELQAAAPGVRTSTVAAAPASAAAPRRRASCRQPPRSRRCRRQHSGKSRAPWRAVGRRATTADRTRARSTRPRTSRSRSRRCQCTSLRDTRRRTSRRNRSRSRPHRGPCSRNARRCRANRPVGRNRRAHMPQARSATPLSHLDDTPLNGFDGITRRPRSVARHRRWRSRPARVLARRARREARAVDVGPGSVGPRDRVTVRSPV
jgi:hypothetical protein